MVNLEWLRTFRAVYRTKSLSRASEILNISQPTVSQHIQALEVYVGQKLFTRKSKGVLETDEGKIINTLVSGSIELLEEAENKISRQFSKNKTVLTIGLSPHLYKSLFNHTLLELEEYVHIKFGTKQTLIKDVEENRLLYAIVPNGIPSFDMNCNQLFDQKLVIAYTTDIDFSNLEKIYKNNIEEAEQVLINQTWFAHDTAFGYIKQFWMQNFDKKRPSIIANYVIPDEQDLLVQLSKMSGLTIATDSVVAPFVSKGLLKTIDLNSIYFRTLSLLSNKKKAPKEMTNKILELLQERF